MPARGVRRQLETDIPLFRDTHDRHGRRHARDQPGRDRASFVEHVLELHVAPRQQRGRARRAPSAPQLLVMPERQVDRAPWSGAPADQPLHGLEQRHQVALVVHRAAAPHEAARNPARERRLRPAALRARLDRHDVLVRHEQDRLQCSVRAAPLVQQAEPARDLASEPCVQPREAGPQIVLKPPELRGVELRGVLIRDRAKPQRARQPLGGGRGVEQQWWYRLYCELSRLEPIGADDQDGGEHNEGRGDDGDEDSAHGVTLGEPGSCSVN